MSLFGPLYTGVAGLAAQGKAMSMISDDIANVNTTGYKGTIADFSTLVTENNDAELYNPGSVQALAGQTITIQGVIQGTSSPTDAAIDGAGFFVVNSKPDGTGAQFYTRDGSFTPDSLGNLRTASGFYLQGWALDANQQIANVNAPTTVNVSGVTGVPTATTTVKARINLDADQTVYSGIYTTGAMATYAATGGSSGVQPSFVRPVQVYDSLGRPHELNLAFLRTGAANSWAIEVYADAQDVDTTVHPNGLVASGTATFNGDGSLAGLSFTPVAAGTGTSDAKITWSAASGAAPSDITFNLGTVGQADGLSQLASPTNVSFVDQNGAAVGQLNGVSIDDQGYVVGSFTNGQQRRLYQLPIATFANPDGLAAHSGNVFAQTDGSGLVNLRLPGTGGAGTVTPSALEGANVDLADEFTRMIITQRAYSANARVITTTDQMLSELLQMSR